MNISNIKKTYYYLKRNGIKKTMGAVAERICSPYFKDYQYVQPAKQELLRQREESKKRYFLVLWFLPMKQKRNT